MRRCISPTIAKDIIPIDIRDTPTHLVQPPSISSYHRAKKKAPETRKDAQTSKGIAIRNLIFYSSYKKSFFCFFSNPTFLLPHHPCPPPFYSFNEKKKMRAEWIIVSLVALSAFVGCARITIQSVPQGAYFEFTDDRVGFCAGKSSRKVLCYQVDLILRSLLSGGSSEGFNDITLIRVDNSTVSHVMRTNVTGSRMSITYIISNDR